MARARVNRDYGAVTMRPIQADIQGAPWQFRPGPHEPMARAQSYSDLPFQMFDDSVRVVRTSLELGKGTSL
ncbi:hypothetical protein GCM10011614_34780 [Novosphingobium colocasiae]|uniref:Uncharacterized protein n=1 Tax=Novosphingobium colocasiae TaxID=1256513 RepID=A0A918UK28_9SPHN|nr:hypothetical protein GCM10011614_34780 [Novosphingobium colocasiae]